MIGSVSESIDFELGKKILGKFLKKPVNDHPSFDPALAVENKYYFAEFGFVKRFFNDSVAVADVLGGIVEVSLD